MTLSQALAHITLNITYIDMDSNPRGIGKDPGIAFTPTPSGRMVGRKLKDGMGSKVPVKFTPILTLLAKHLNTNRVDLVNCAFPLLGCPTLYFDHVLTPAFVTKLDEVIDRRKRQVGLWEVLDLAQSVLGWDKRRLIELVQAVETVVPAGVVTQLAALADAQREENNRTGGAVQVLLEEQKPLVVLQ